MQGTEFTAEAQATINATADEVWRALTDPELIRQYMFGATVTSDWQEGSSIMWKGEMNGKPFADKGRILKIAAPSLLQYSHYSPVSGVEDKPENYHTVTIVLNEAGGKTQVVLTQDKNENDAARQHAEKNWTMMLEGLKKVVEAL